MWRRDGKELFYVSPDSQMLSVVVKADEYFQRGVPRELFSGGLWGPWQGPDLGPYDVTADGQRILFHEYIDVGRGRSLMVAQNWFTVPERQARV